MPRLHQFVARFPNIDLRVSGSPEFANFVSDHVDIDIRYGKPNWKDLQVVPLMKEEVMPLCSPRLLEGPDAIRTPSDLDRATLIELDSAIMGWNDWFEINGLDPPKSGQHLHFDRSVMSIQAGVDGLGIILDSTTLAARELADGRLVRPFADSMRSLEVTGHFLVYPKANAKIPIVAEFLAWVRELQT